MEMTERLSSEEIGWLDTVLPASEWDYDPDRLRFEMRQAVERILTLRQKAPDSGLLVEADSLISLARHRGVDVQWKSDADQWIAKARS